MTAAVKEKITSKVKAIPGVQSVENHMELATKKLTKQSGSECVAERADRKIAVGRASKVSPLP